MKNKLLLLIIGLLTCTLSYGQTESSNFSRNNAYLELLGNGGLYSINYERIVVQNFALRLGFGAWKSIGLFGAGDKSFVTVPILGNFLFGKKNSKFEVGAGFLFGREKEYSTSFNPNSNKSSSIFNLTGVIGYRYQPSTAGLMFRVGLTPFYALTGGEDAYPESGLTLSGGLSIGYNF
ncbi:hypothetical protein BH23BAC1_BH23BAC1_19560 [soil metagenome]